MNTLIVIPAKDEEDLIGKVIDDIRTHTDLDILVVNDCSLDSTPLIAEQKGCVVLSHAINLGAWKATQTGIRYALQSGYESVVSMDADGQHRGEDLVRLLDARDQGFDLIIGSCVERGNASRKIAWSLFRGLSGLKVSDLTSGFRVYSKPLMLALAGKRASMFDFQDIGVLLFAKHLNMRIKEVHIEMRNRASGISRIFGSWKAVLMYMIYTLILTISKSMFVTNKKFLVKVFKEGQND